MLFIVKRNNLIIIPRRARPQLLRPHRLRVVGDACARRLFDTNGHGAVRVVEDVPQINHGVWTTAEGFSIAAKDLGTPIMLNEITNHD